MPNAAPIAAPFVTTRRPLSRRHFLRGAGVALALPALDVPQQIDGTSLVPILKDPQVAIRDHAAHCFPRGNSHDGCCKYS